MTRRAASVVALIALTILLASLPANASTFKATLGSFRLYGRSGQVLTRAFHLTLDEDQPKTRFRAHVEDWWRSEDGRQSFYAPPGTLNRSCGEWVALNPVEQDISAGQTLTVRITVSVPGEVRPGGFWCVLTVDEVRDPLAPADDVDVRFLASISTGIFVYIDPLERAAQITGVDVGRDLVAVTLKNNGNTPLAIEGRFEFTKSGATEPSAVVRLPRSTLLTQPVTTGSFSVALPDPSVLPSGRYVVRAIVDYGIDHYIGVERELEVTREEQPSHGAAR